MECLYARNNEANVGEIGRRQIKKKDEKDSRNYSTRPNLFAMKNDKCK